MSTSGDHTWERYLHYHCCPSCRYVFENRSDYVMEQKQETKKLNCPRCQQAFTVVRQRNLARAPLLGRPQPPEIDWK